MIYSVRGKVAHLLPTSVVVETASGVDYLVKISLLTSSEISKENQPSDWKPIPKSVSGFKRTLPDGIIKLLTVFKIREDSQDLYGFLNTHDRDTFNLLTSVSGIGPSKAMMLMSTYNSDQINNFVVNSQVDMLSKAKGFGKKFAERIVSELRDKVNATEPSGRHHVPFELKHPARKDAIDALCSLGFAKKEAEVMVDKFVQINPTANIEEIIKGCLRS